MSEYPDERLADVVDYLQRGKTPKYAVSGEVRIVNQKCVRWGRFDPEPARHLDSSVLGKWKSERFLAPGDVLINSTGEGTIGRAVKWEPRGSERWVADSHVTVVRPNASQLDSRWLEYWFRSELGQSFVSDQKTGATKQTELGAKRLAEARIPLPTLDEQQRVVARLDQMMERLDEAIQLRRTSAKETGHLEGAVFADFAEAHIKGNGIPVLPFGAVLRRAQYGSSSKANTQSRGVPMLRMGNIKDGQLDVSDLKHIELGAAELDKYRLNQGDVLINRTNSLERVGKTAVFNLQKDWVFASYLVRLVVDESRVLPEYVSAAINSRIGRRYVHRTARRAIGMVNINVKEIKAMPLPIPSLDAQREVVRRMADVRHAVGQMRSNFAEFDAPALRGSILRKAFAGEL